MPYVIEVPNRIRELVMPERCPYCLARDHGDHIEVRYQKQLAIIPAPLTAFLFAESIFRFPACVACARQVRMLGKLAWPVTLVPLTAMLFALFLEWPAFNAFVYAAMAGAGISGLLLMIRQLKIMRFRVGYQDGESSLIYASSGEYAREMAQLNHIPMRFRWFVFRWY